MIKTQLQMVRPPRFCDDCGRKIVDLASSADKRLTQLMQHCPHHQTLVLVTLDTVNEEPAIVKWIMESPCSERRAIEMATLLSEKTGAEMDFFHSGPVQ